MKKLFVLSCVALATLASCSKSEDIEAPQAQMEIAFSVATDKSRAPIEDDEFPTSLSMYVSAYNSVSGKYFKGVEFSKDASETTWKAGKYWPVNGITSFLAYAYTPTANSKSNNAAGNDAADVLYLDTLVKYAMIIISTVPILCIYPFVQKYFMKGVMMGSVKE